MTPVQLEELSALLDGELDARRAAEVQRRIAADAELRAAFEALREADSQWRRQARNAAFAPDVSLARARLGPRAATALGAGSILVALRIAVRGIDAAAAAYGLQAAVLLVILAATAVLILPQTAQLEAR